MADQLWLPEMEGETPQRRVEDHLPVHAKSALDQSAAYLADLRDYSHGEASPILVPVLEAARLLSIGKTLMWDMVRRNEIPTVRIGRRVLVPRGALESLARTKADVRPNDSATTAGGEKGL